MNQYGALPKETVINDQYHQLSYIRPDEAELLKSLGGMGTSGPGGIPQYGWWGDTFESIGNAISSGASAVTNAVSNTVSSAVDFVSDAGNAAVEVIKDVYQGTANVLTPFDDKEYVDGVLTTTSTGKPVSDTPTQPLTDPDTGLTFNEAYAQGRSAGKQTFFWRGGEYNTDLPAQQYYDMFGNAHSTQAEANAADELYSQEQEPTIQDLQSNLDNLISQGFSEGDPPYEQAKEQLNNELANLGEKITEGDDQVQDYIDQWGTSYLEDRFLTGRINPATGLPYQPRDTNIVNPSDADTMSYTPGGLDDDEILYLGGDPYSSTTEGVDTGEEIIADDVSETSPVVIYPEDAEARIVTTTYPKSYGTRMRGGIWDRFAYSPYTRFGVSPMQSTKIVKVVEQADGSKLYYDQEGNLVNPYEVV